MKSKLNEKDPPPDYVTFFGLQNRTDVQFILHVHVLN